MGARSYISGHKRKIAPMNLFGVGTVGGGWEQYLKDLYATPTDKSKQYNVLSTALRDALTMESDTMKDEFGAAASSGGFFDSGARLAGLSDINRNRIASYSQGLSQILAKLESDKMSAAFPYLQARIGEFSAYQNALYQQDELQTQRKKQIAQTIGAVFGGGMGGGQQPTGGYTSGYDPSAGYGGMSMM